MIKLHYKTNKGRMESYKAMQNVADDIKASARHLNNLLSEDRELPCPSSRKRDDYGIANCAVLWFGNDDKEDSTLDIDVKQRTTITLNAKQDKWLYTLFQLTVISLIEQFTASSSFETDEDFTLAVGIWEELFGSIPKKVSTTLGIEIRE